MTMVSSIWSTFTLFPKITFPNKHLNDNVYWLSPFVYSTPTFSRNLLPLKLS